MNNRIVYITIMSWLSFLQAMSQTAEPSVYLGLEVLKPVIASVDRGYVFEPSVSYKLKDETVLRVVLGKTVVNRYGVLSNLDYQADGYYVKAGVGRRIRNFFEPNVSLGYSAFTETGKTKFSGPYYGDWVSTLKQRQQLLFTEVQINFWIKISEKIYIVPNVRMVYLLQRPNEALFPTYYVPGAGHVLFEQFLDSNTDTLPKSSILTGGISVNLLYKIF
jgi:hypothetical protein